MQLLLALEQHESFDESWNVYLDQVSRDVTDLAAKVTRDTDEKVPLPDPLADDGDPADADRAPGADGRGVRPRPRC